MKRKEQHLEQDLALKQPSSQLDQDALEALVTLALETLREVESFTPLHIGKIVAGIEKRGRKVSKAEKAQLIEELARLSDAEQLVYQGLDENTFGAIEEEQESQEDSEPGEHDVETEPPSTGTAA